MVRLRLSASRSARARWRPSLRSLRLPSRHCAVLRRHARERARLRPALRAAAAAGALSVRRGGGGRALVRRVRAVRAPRQCAARLRPNRSARQPDRADGRRIPLSFRRSGSPCSACSSSPSSPACSATTTPTATSRRPWCGSSGGWASPTCRRSLGDIWALVNPWRTVFDAAEWLYRRLGGGSELGWRRPYPQALGAWPACILLLAFCWTELVYPNAAVPAHIAWLAIAYSVLTWAGMLVFGRDAWLQHGEVFSLVFGTFARFAPTEARDGRLLLRPLRRGAARRPPGVDLDDGLRAAAAGDRALRRADRHRRMGGAGRRAALSLAGIGRNQRHGDQDRRPRRLLAGCSSAPISASCAVMSWVASGRPGAARDRAQLCPDAGPDRHRLSRGALPGVPAGAGPIHHPAPLRPVRLRLEPVRHRRLSRRHRRRRRALCLVRGRRGHRHRSCDRRLSRARAGARRVRAAPRGAGDAGAADRADGGLHLHRPLHHRRADRGEPGSHEPSAVASEAIAVPPDAVLFRQQDSDLQRRDRQDRQGQAHLQGAGLRLSRPDQDDRGGSRSTPMCSPTGGALEAQAGTLSTTRSSTPPPRPCAGTSSRCARSASTPAPSPSGSATSISCARSSPSRSISMSAPTMPKWNAVVAPPWSTLPWHVLALMEEAVTRGWAAFSQAEATRRGVPWLDLVRSERDERQAGVAAAAVRARGIPAASPACPRQRGGGAPALGGAGGVLQGQRPFPGDQRALQAQELDARRA